MKKLFLFGIVLVLLASAFPFVWPHKITEPNARASAIFDFKHEIEKLHLPQTAFDGPLPGGGSQFSYYWIAKDPAGAVSSYGYKPVYGIIVGYSQMGLDEAYVENRPIRHNPLSAAEAAAFRANVMTVPPIETAVENCFWAIVFVWLTFTGYGFFHLMASRFVQDAGEPVSDGGIRGWLWPTIQSSTNKSLSPAAIHKRQFRRTLPIILAPIPAFLVFYVMAWAFIAVTG